MRPFAPPERAANPLAEVRHGAGVTVLEIHGAPEPTARALRHALIDALLDRDVPAAPAPGNRRSLVVHGVANAAPAAEGRLDVETIWHVVDPDARPVGRHRTSVRPPAGAWRSGETEMVAALAAAAAEGIAALVPGGDRAAPPGGRGVFLRTLRMPLDLDGATLRRSLEGALPAAGLRLTRRRTETDLLLSVSVTLGPRVGGRRRLGLLWRLAGPDGREIGRLEQANPVETSALSAGWPALARTIADALAPELRSMLAAAEETPPDGVTAGR